MLGSAVPILAICATATIIGLALCIVAWRRRTGDDPHCRKCEFNLRGRWPDTASCPECGFEHGGRAKPRTGHRQRRRAPLIAGVLIILAASCVATVKIASVRGAIDLDRHKPTWLLMLEAKPVNGRWTASALRELLSRFELGDLDDDRLAALAERALVAVEQDERPAEWDDVLDQAWGARLVDRDRYFDYAVPASTELTELTVRRARGGWAFVMVRLQFTRLKEPLAFEITLRDGERTWAFSRIGVPPNRQTAGFGYRFGYGKTLPDFDAQRVDVVLISSVEEAEASFGTSAIWLGEIVFEDVEVVPEEPSE